MTTDESMGIFTAEDRREKYNAYAQCTNCNGWTYLFGSAETYGQITTKTKQVCQHCGGHSFDPRSATSKRTWNPLTAKKRKPKNGTRT